MKIFKIFWRVWNTQLFPVFTLLIIILAMKESFETELLQERQWALLGIQFASLHIVFIIVIRTLKDIRIKHKKSTPPVESTIGWKKFTVS